jgi:hypothetical protein
MSATIPSPGETEAGSAGKQPCRGITWWAHPDDEPMAGRGHPRSAPASIGGIDPPCLENPIRPYRKCLLRKRESCARPPHGRRPIRGDPGKAQGWGTRCQVLHAAMACGQPADGQHGDVVFLAEFPGRVGDVKGGLVAQIVYAVKAEELAGRRRASTTPSDSKRMRSPGCR